jgi:8-oxo-dGTP pyrophosphatase MutT (NUDIX family)
MSNQVTLRDQWGNLAVTISCKAIVRSDELIWLRKNERNDWELPGGRLEENEQPEETVAREIREELGLKIENLTLVDAYIWKKDFGSTTHIELLTFACTIGDIVGGFEVNSEAGNAHFKQFSVTEALELENLPEPYKRAIRKA